MKLKTITYAMLRSTAMYENDRVEVTVEVDDEKDDLGQAVRWAKRVCEAALVIGSTPPRTFEAIVNDDDDEDPSPLRSRRRNPRRS